jgi:hypothetical protein
MEILEHELREWREMPAEALPVSRLVTHGGLQPRNPRVRRLKESARAEQASELHTERLAASLSADSTKEYEPLLVAEVEGKQYVVDGHHRLAAYKRARRRQVPVRIRRMELERAALLSKLVNTDHVKLPLTRGEAAESAWAYLAAITARGRMPLPNGQSLRSVAEKFGVASHETIRGMLKRLPLIAERLRENDIPPQWCDEATGWPLWNHVRNELRDRFGEIDFDPDVQAQRQIARCAKGIAKLIEDYDLETFRRAYRYLRRQEAEETADPAV